MAQSAVPSTVWDAQKGIAFRCSQERRWSESKQLSLPKPALLGWHDCAATSCAWAGWAQVVRRCTVRMCMEKGTSPNHTIRPHLSVVTKSVPYSICVHPQPPSGN